MVRGGAAAVTAPYDAGTCRVLTCFRDNRGHTERALGDALVDQYGSLP